MISHKHKCIFIHIPKCAGTSFEEALGHFEGHEGREGQDHRSVRMIQKPFPVFSALSSAENIKDTIRRYREYSRTPANPKNAIQVNSKQYQEYFKFTVVRHPVERAYSWYKNAMRDPIQQRNYNISSNIDFDSFVRKFAGTGYLRPQTYWLLNYSGQIDMDLIVKFEELHEGFRAVCDRLSIQKIVLPHKVSGDGDLNSTSISEKTIEFIQCFYSDDYTMLGY